jgi:uncharacterized protein YdaU (DUF1376 family)
MEVRQLDRLPQLALQLDRLAKPPISSTPNRGAHSRAQKKSTSQSRNQKHNQQLSNPLALPQLKQPEKPTAITNRKQHPARRINAPI